MKDNLADTPLGHDHLRSSDIQSLTQQPFGETERLAEDDDLKDVAFLDLNAPPAEGHTLSGNQSTLDRAPTSDRATLTIPSIPLSTSQATLDGTKDELSDSSEGRHRRNKSQPAPRRPATISEGNTPSLSTGDRPMALPLAKTGAISPPEVREAKSRGQNGAEGHDVLLDIDGYHTGEQEPLPSGEQTGADIHLSVLDTFTRDLLAAVPTDKRPVMPLRATDPDFHVAGSPTSESPELPSDVEEREARRFDRAKSEPPADSPEPISPTLDPSKTASAMDYAWDWGRIPDGSDGKPHPSPERRGTLPPMDLPSRETMTRLKNVEENPYLFVFDADGRTHTFELALCEGSTGTDQPNSDYARATEFLDNRVTFQEFIENPSIVDDPKLVVRYSLQ